MNSKARLVPWLVWGFLGFLCLSIAVVFFSTLLKEQGKPLPVYGDVPNFHLTNQLGQTITLADLRGHPWIADIIFTRCAGPCPEMTRKMKAIQDALPRGSTVKLVSLTADPEFDTPSVLKEYGARFGANPTNWHFLTGSKKAIVELATRGLKLALQENDAQVPPEEQWIHSTRFVLVDGRGQLRSVSFEGTEAQTVAKIVRAAADVTREGYP